MQAGERIELRITGLSHQGAGIGRSEEIAVFVPGAMLGETVAARVETRKKRMATAELLEVLDPSPERTAPRCGESGRCGGCELQHCQYAYQLRAKRQIVADALERLGRVRVDVAPVLGMADPWRYRNKGIFHAEYSGGVVRLGFYQQASHQLVPADGCLLFSEAVNDLLRRLERLIQESGRANYIEKVMLRESSLNGAIMVVLVTSEDAWRLPDLPRLLLQYPGVVSVYQNVNPNSKLMLGRRFQHLAGKTSLEEALRDEPSGAQRENGAGSAGTAFRFQISPQSFFQVNSRQAEVLYRVILRFAALTGSEQVLDLYCGIGTISLFLARRAAWVTGVESVQQAVLDARQNAAYNGVQNCTFVAAKAEEWLPRWQKQGHAADVAVLDPPRKGCEPRLLQALEEGNVPRIVYVSCNPSTLARDVQLLHAQGYAVQQAQPVDLFCQSWHVETVVLMSRVRD